MATSRSAQPSVSHNSKLGGGREDSGDGSSINAVAHTLTACTRCRTRKTRCDPGLPKCGPCQRTGQVCEYFDSNKGQVISRSYVVHLQHKVKELEEMLDKLENEDGPEDPEAMMRSASIRMSDAKETKFLGPASGIAITRLVMQLAKQFTDAQSIKEIVPDSQAAHIKDLYHQESDKPTSKVYPLCSNVAAIDLPGRGLADELVKLYKKKVQPMYPALHEPTLDQDIAAVYQDTSKATSFQNFIVRMVIAISLQKMDTQYAGLADSFYLAALKYMEPCVRKMDLQTLQCFALMAEYSLLTPTRTAIYFVMGIAVRLVQSLGYHEEKGILQGHNGQRANDLEIDMRRRIFWCIFVMECGLAHSLGRPSMLATKQEHIDVGWFDTREDKYITEAGIDTAGAPTLKKWLTIHFFNMRLLQLEIRRKLYLKKRPTPKDDHDPWFQQMEAKISAWKDASPDDSIGSGLDRQWHVGRYQILIIFLYRPSPQVPRPSLQAAMKCFDACEHNIHMQREQIARKNVDLTWIFTQSMFMAINTILWCLSYSEVRRIHSRAKLEKLLAVALESCQLASERWPGVASAVQLYHNLIQALLKIYEKDGDVPISATTPSDVPSPSVISSDPLNRSRATSPATVGSTASIATPTECAAPPFGYLHHPARQSVEQAPPMPYTSSMPNASPSHSMAAMSNVMAHISTMSGNEYPTLTATNGVPNSIFDPYTQFVPLPEFTSELTVPGWGNLYTPTQEQNNFDFAPMQHHQPLQNLGFGALLPNQVFDSSPQSQQHLSTYTNQFWDIDASLLGGGLTYDQQQELMQTLESEGMDDIQHMLGVDVVKKESPYSSRAGTNELMDAQHRMFAMSTRDAVSMSASRDSTHS